MWRDEAEGRAIDPVGRPAAVFPFLFPFLPSVDPADRLDDCLDVRASCRRRRRC